MRVFISAGDVSGDFHASRLIDALRKEVHSIEFWGIGREKLMSSGVKLIASMERYDVVGLDGLLQNGPSLYNLTRSITDNIRGTDLAVFVDYPGYNVLLARYFKRYGIKNIYYIPPQVWGWWRFRAKLVKRYFDALLVIYPFEVDFWRQFGVDAVYVGNPVYDSVINSDIQILRGVPDDKNVIGLLPGSRYSEVKRILPRMLEVKRILEKKYSNLHFLLSLVPEGINVPEENNLQIVRGMGKSVMKSSDVVMVASGTATLEGALLGKPMVVLYELSPLSYFIGTMVKRVEFLSLVNILAEKQVVKEFVQNINPLEVSKEVESLLFDEEKLRFIRQEYSKIKNSLSGNAPYSAARFIKRRFLNERYD